MTERTLDETKVREAAMIARRIAKNDPDIENKEPAVELGQTLGQLVGKSLETFRSLDDEVRNKLRQAALVVNQKFNSDDQIFGFLRNVCGNLKRCTKPQVDSSNFGRIAVFLTALVSVAEATALKMSLHIF